MDKGRQLSIQGVKPPALHDVVSSLCVVALCRQTPALYGAHHGTELSNALIECMEWLWDHRMLNEEERERIIAALSEL